MSAADAPLPPGWTSHFNTEYGEFYYHNKATGESVWERPTVSIASNVNVNGISVTSIPVAKSTSEASQPTPIPSAQHAPRIAPLGYGTPHQSSMQSISKVRLAPPETSMPTRSPVPAMPSSTSAPTARRAEETRPIGSAQDKEFDDPWADLDSSTTPVPNVTPLASLRPARPKSPGSSPQNVWSNYNANANARGSSMRARSRPGPRFAMPGPVSHAADGQWQPHVPCLLDEAVDSLMDPKMRQPDGKNSGIYVDCTFGRGGHTQKILDRLSQAGRLFSFDVDHEAVAEARKLEQRDPRFRIIHRPFGDLAEVLVGVPLNGVLADLGVSSPQLDDRHRGFNVTEAGPLDLRMNQQQGIPAREWLRDVKAEELAWVIKSYGEDHDSILAERIAEYILARQKDFGGVIPLTTQLSDIVKQAKANINDSGMHPSKLTFQAIRIFLNQEMQQLDDVLSGAFQRLVPDGRCCIISFKRMEAEAVTKFVREHEEPDQFLANRLDNARLCELFPLLLTDKSYAVKQLCEPIRPSAEEIARNTRSRSSAVHVLMKVQRKGAPCQLNSEVRLLSERFVQPSFRPQFVGACEVSNEDIAQTIASALVRTSEATSAQSSTPIQPSLQSRAPQDARLTMPSLQNADIRQIIPSSQSYQNAVVQDVTTSRNTLHETPVVKSRESEISVTKPPEREATQHNASQSKPEFLWVGRGCKDHFPHMIRDGGSRDVGGHIAFLINEHIGVLYEGSKQDEVGWAYGKLLDSPGAGVTGWFPINRVTVARWPIAPHEAG